MYVTLRFQMSLFMYVIGPECLELSALELEKLPYLTLFTLLLCKYRPINTKLGHHIYDHKISDKYDYGFNRTTGVNCP